MVVAADATLIETPSGVRLFMHGNAQMAGKTKRPLSVGAHLLLSSFCFEFICFVGTTELYDESGDGGKSETNSVMLAMVNGR